jgi:hypothetical protein
MLLVVVYLYVASAAQWAMNVWVTLTKIHGFLMVPNVPFRNRPELAEAAILKVVGVQEAIFDFNVCAGSQSSVIIKQVIRWPSETVLSFGALGPFISTEFSAGFW